MEWKLNEMVGWERQKALFIASIAERLGMDTSGYGEMSVNPNSGNVYLWLENYPFTLAMPIHCDLKRSDIDVWVWNSENGDEESFTLGNMNLDEIYEEVERIQKEWEQGA